MFDLLIRGATVYDGTGGPGFIADVAVQGGRIAAVGKDLGEARDVLQAEGLCVSPGWTDTHSHAERYLELGPHMKEKIEQGITFCVNGHCGTSVAPSVREDGTVRSFREYYGAFKDASFGCSSAVLVGHGNIRHSVMGSANRQPDRQEFNRMVDAVDAALDNGALGMSFGLFYAPGSFATQEELVTLMSRVGAQGKTVSAHIRNEGDTLVESVEEFIELTTKAGCKGVISHHKAMEPRNWGKVRKTLELIDQANASGCDIYMDMYPYTASETSLRSRFAPALLHPPGSTGAMRLLEDPAMCKIFKEWGIERWGEDLNWTLLSSCPGYPEYEGKTIREISQMLGREDQYEVAYDLIRWTKGYASASFFLACEEDLETVLRHPRAMLCTDSGLAGTREKYHPRLRASFPKALGRYVREQGTLTMEEMIRRMTSLPAQVYGLENKGLVREGYDADLCVFDSKTIKDRADYNTPTLPNVGLSYVLVGGTVVVEDGKHNGKNCGKLYLR